MLAIKLNNQNFSVYALKMMRMKCISDLIKPVSHYSFFFPLLKKVASQLHSLPTIECLI